MLWLPCTMSTSGNGPAPSGYQTRPLTGILLNPKPQYFVRSLPAWPGTSASLLPSTVAGLQGHRVAKDRAVLVGAASVIEGPHRMRPAHRRIGCGDQLPRQDDRRVILRELEGSDAGGGGTRTSSRTLRILSIPNGGTEPFDNSPGPEWLQSLTGVRWLRQVTSAEISSNEFPIHRFPYIPTHGTSDLDCNLALHPFNEFVDRQNVLLLPRPPHPHGQRSGFRFATPHHRHVRNLHQLCFTNAVVQRLVASSSTARMPAAFMRATASRRLRRLVVGDRQHAHLLRREPDRERAREVLDEDGDEALERAAHRAVDDHRPMRRCCPRRRT